MKKLVAAVGCALFVYSTVLTAIERDTDPSVTEIKCGLGVGTETCKNDGGLGDDVAIDVVAEAVDRDRESNLDATSATTPAMAGASDTAGGQASEASVDDLLAAVEEDRSDPELREAQATRSRWKPGRSTAPPTGDSVLDVVVVRSDDGGSIYDAEVTLQAKFVRSTGAPVTQAVMTQAVMTQAVMTQNAARDGVARFEGLAVGRYDVVVRARGFALAYQTVAVRARSKRPVDVVTFELTFETLQAGCVVDQEGEPLADAAVWVRHANGHEYPVGTTDVTGEFVVGELGSRPVTIVAFAAGYTFDSQSGVVAHAAKRVTLRLEPGLEFAVRVIDDKYGQPISGATVALSRVESSDSDEATSRDAPGWATCDASGRATIAGLIAGRFMATIAAPHYREARVEIVVAAVGSGRSSRRVFRLRLGSEIEGYVVDSDGKPLAGALVRARPTEGAVFGVHVDISDDEGRFVLPRLGSEPYAIQIRHRGFETVSGVATPGAAIDEWRVEPIDTAD